MIDLIYEEAKQFHYVKSSRLQENDTLNPTKKTLTAFAQEYLQKMVSLNCILNGFMHG